MKEIAIRTALLAYAALAAFLLWLPSDAPPHPTLGSYSFGSILLGSYYFWTVFISDSTAILALGLVALLMVRPEVHRGAIPLAICLCSAVIAWGVVSANEIPGFSGLVTLAVVFSGMLFSAAGLLRFLSVFPTELSTDELAHGLSSLRWGRHEASDPIAARVSMIQSLDRKFTCLVWLPLMGKSLYRRLATEHRRFARWVRRLDVVDDGRLTQMHAHQIQKPWSIAFKLTLLFAIAVLVTPSTIDDISGVYGIAGVLGACFGLLVTVPFVALIVARTGYLRADAEMRHRSLWVLEALLLAVSIFIVMNMADFASHIVWDTRMLGLTALGMACASLAFVVCLILALFSGGAFDPRLVIRGTVFVGLLSIVLAFMFAVVEDFVTNQISVRFNLPESTGMVVSAAIAAAVFGPLWKSANRWVSRQLRTAVPRGPAAGPKLHPSP